MEKKSTKSLIDKIKDVIMSDEPKEEIKLEEALLADEGGTLFAEVFEAGESVYILDEEGERLPLPVGEYVLEGGNVLVVTTEGIIESIGEAVAEEAPTEEAPVEEEMKSVEESEEKPDLAAELAKELTQLSKENEEMKKEMESRASEGIKTSPEGKGKRKMKTAAELQGLKLSQRINTLMEGIPFKTNLATTTSITSTYAGEFAGQYIAAATLQGATLAANAITVKPNIKYKETIKIGAFAGGSANRTCDFTDAGTITLTEVILEPKELQVQREVCKADFRSDWEAMEMGVGSWDTLPPSFTAFMLEQLAAELNEEIESNIWHGVTATAGDFGGLIPAMTADSTVVDVVGTTVTSANVLVEMAKVVDAIPTAVRKKQDLTLYVSQNVVDAYVRALGGFGTVIAENAAGTENVGIASVGANGISGLGPLWFSGQALTFEGIGIFVAEGMTDNYMVAAQKSNLFYGTGLLDDKNEVKVLDMQDLDLSENVRISIKYTATTTHGIGSDVVLYTPA